jgi:hypothetical protein
MQKIRVWKLGSLEHMIMPTEESYKQLDKRGKQILGYFKE